MSTLDKPTPSQLNGGLNKDLTYQKPGDATFALNAIRDAHDGGKAEYQSEPGNELVESLPSGFIFMGSIYGQDNELYLFASNNTTLGTIGTFKEGKYTELVRADFGWKIAHPISGEYRVKNGCERIIYWCNGDSPDGYFNIDRPELFKTSGGAWIVNKFKSTPDVSPPKVDFVQVNDGGGSNPLGSYYFQFKYLDANLNEIYKTDITPQVVIYDDSQSDSYNNIDGGLNIAQYSPEIGGVPLTNKSITLALSNLDTQFPYLQAIVLRQIGADGSTDAHAVGTLITVNDTAIKWTYTGYNTFAGDFPVDVSETLTDNIRYSTSYVMEQVQNRLIRAAVKKDVRDYSTYQSYSSKVTTKWKSNAVLLNDISNSGDAKNPETYWTGATFQGDEIYAIGQRFLHADGSWSPVFHIPGRPSTNFDTASLDILINSSPITNEFTQVWASDVEHLGLLPGETVEKWRVQNTALRDFGEPSTGVMGYYETDETYPDIRDCNNDLIWGEDSEDNPITADTKIRHHRLPDRRMIPIFTEDGLSIQPLGIQFNNITYPPDVVGHQFCYALRNESNKTVVDSGWFFKVLDNQNSTYADAHFPGTQEEDGITLTGRPKSTDVMAGNSEQVEGLWGGYISGDILFKNQLHNIDYIKTNRAYLYRLNEQTNTNYGELTDAPLDLKVRILNSEYIDAATLARENYKVKAQQFAPPYSITSHNTNFPTTYNTDFLSPSSVIKTTYEIEAFSDVLPDDAGPETQIKVAYTYKKRAIKPYGDLFNLAYSYLHVNHVSDVSSSNNIFFGADTLISLSLYTSADIIDDAPDFRYLDGYGLDFMYEERDINTSLRYGGTLKSTTYNKNIGDTQWLVNKAYTLGDDGRYTSITPYKGESFIPEYYAYNSDYTLNRLQYSKIVLPITYNYCSDCIGDFYSQIIFSPKSFDEESFDLYRINKANDYITLPGHRGRITGLKYQNNLLLVHTEDTTFILQPNPQSLATDTSTVYLTTGDFLSIPPAELHQTDIGYGGMQSKQHQCDTPYGHCWVDQRRGNVFSFDNQLNDLGNKGMDQWFRENLPSELKTSFYQIKEYPYPQTSTIDTYGNGVGVILYYDPRYKRLIITKKDYYPINFTQRGILFGETSFNDATMTWYYQPITGPQVIVYFSNTTTFENKSWTLSYSFEYQTWTSFHSYRPLAAFSDDSHYYTIPQNNFDVYKIYRHKTFNSYQTYYGSKYDFIIEWMIYDAGTDSLDAVHYSGYTLQRDTTTKQWKQIEETFNKGMFYNYTQSTGLVNLSLINNDTNPYANLTSNNTLKYIAKTDQNYKISQLYDVSIDYPVITADWNALKLIAGYADITVNTTNINTAKNQYDLGNLNDKFILSRLYFKPTLDCKKVVNLLVTNESRSIR